MGLGSSTDGRPQILPSPRLGKGWWCPRVISNASRNPGNFLLFLSTWNSPRASSSGSLGILGGRRCLYSSPPLLKGSTEVKVKVFVAQSCPSLCNIMDCSPPGSSVHGILQAIILEWVATSFPGNLPNSGIEPASSALRWILYHLSHEGSHQSPEAPPAPYKDLPDWCGDYLPGCPSFPSPLPFISSSILLLNLHLFQNSCLSYGSTWASGHSAWHTFFNRR